MFNHYHNSSPIITASPLFAIVAFAFAFQLHLVASFAGVQIDRAGGRGYEVATWRLRSTDTKISPTSWDIRTETNTDADPTLPSNWERVSFVCGSGSEVLLGIPVEPTLVIPELTCELSVASEQEFAQLFVEVTFPNTPSPTDDGPLKALVRGPTIQTAAWQRLKFGSKTLSIAEALDETVWILRGKYGIPIDRNQDYIDRVLVNVYARPGNHRVRLSQPMWKGNVPVDPMSITHSVLRDLQVQTIGFQTEDERPNARAQRDGTVIEIDGTPFLGRLIQHNGETFSFLKSIGFNVIQLPTTATSEQLRQARELDIWIVCPPPPSAGLKPMGAFYDPVVAWSLGEALTRQELTATQNLSREIKEFDSRKGRPSFASVSTQWSEYSQCIDIQTVGLPVLGSFFPEHEYDDWFADLTRTIGGNHPLWSDVPTEHSRAVLQQAGALAGRLPPLPLAREDLETLTMQAIAGGARGFRFLSRSRLDSNDPQTRLRVQTLTWLNQRLQLLEPWIMGGVVMGSVATGDDGIQVTAIKTNRSQLLLIQPQTQIEQFVAGDSAIRTVRFQDSYSAVSDQAYWLTDYGLLPLSQDRSSVGTMIQLDACPANAAVILTQDPQVVQRFNQLYQQQNATSPLLLRSDLTRQWVAFTQLVESSCRLYGRSSPAASGSYNEALNAFQNADALIRSGSPVAAAPAIDLADQKLATTRRELLSLARDQFTAPISNPLFYHASLLAAHWDLAARMRDATWNPNGLAGGDFENIEHMENNGWRYTNTRSREIKTEVTLDAESAAGGTFGLSLAANGSLPPKTLLLEPAITVESAPVKVRSAQMVFIHGWVRIDTVLAGTYDGLRIYDSLGGRELAYSVRKTNGWQEFKLYRAAGESTEVRVTLELNGLGRVAIDEITVKTIDLPLQPENSSPESTASRPTDQPPLSTDR